MAALDFPASPTLNQVYTSGTLSWTWNGTSWVSTNVASGAVASGTMYENSQTVLADYTITTNKNALSAGPVSIASGVTVTVPSGSVWTIV